MDAYIKGISYYLPDKILTNEELINDFPEWNVEKVVSKIGINQRHLTGANETSGDMAVGAASKLFSEYNISPAQIDFILLCTQSPDYYLPTTACIIQHKLGIPTSAGALDYNLGCSGYIYGLSLANGLIVSGIAKNILLLTSETYSKYIHPEDKGNRSIFGDAASATLLSTEGFAKVENFVLGTDGSGAENLIVKTGCSRRPEKANDFEKDKSGAITSSDHLYMDGAEIFNFTLNAVPSLLQETLKRNSETLESIGIHIFHQANKYMLDTLRKVCSIEKDKFYINLSETGNTVSSSIPIALKNAINENIINSNMTVLIAGFGVGYSWGGCVLNFK